MWRWPAGCVRPGKRIPNLICRVVGASARLAASSGLAERFQIPPRGWLAVGGGVEPGCFGDGRGWSSDAVRGPRAGHRATHSAAPRSSPREHVGVAGSAHVGVPVRSWWPGRSCGQLLIAPVLNHGGEDVRVMVWRDPSARWSRAALETGGSARTGDHPLFWACKNVACSHLLEHPPKGASYARSDASGRSARWVFRTGAIRGLRAYALEYAVSDGVVGDSRTHLHRRRAARAVLGGRRQRASHLQFACPRGAPLLRWVAVPGR
jgi:hypothetical protein